MTCYKVESCLHMLILFMVIGMRRKSSSTYIPFPLIKMAIQSVLKHAQNARAITLLEDDPNNNMHYQVLLCHCDSNPELYECWAYPTAWRRGLPLHAHVDVPMHLLFLGVTKTVVKEIME
jgi:hypothetical protein